LRAWLTRCCPCQSPARLVAARNSHESAPWRRATSSARRKHFLRDEGEASARKLDRAGVDVTCTRYNGLIHDYGLLNAMSQVPGVRSAMLQASAELKKRLG